MNIVFVRHGTSKEYCFEVPDIFLPYIKKDMTVLVKTSRGLDIAKTTTDIISGAGAKDVAERNGAYFPLKPVVSFVDLNIFRAIKNEIISQINEATFCPYELPF